MFSIVRSVTHVFSWIAHVERI